MRRHPGYAVTYAFGPGPATPAVKAIIWANVGAFVLTFFLPGLVRVLGLSPRDVIERLWLWQPVTYLFLHHGVFHILFNMLGVWMFGVELERMWGTRAFVKYYAVAGLGAAAATILVGLLPFGFSEIVFRSVTIGASGALYGLLVAYAVYFPHRPILMFLLFPIPAKYFVIVIGAIAFLASLGGPGDIAHAAHLGGLVAGYLYLRGGRGGLTAEIKYRYLKWRMNRMRRKFDVYTGGRRVH
ncbi:MAG TPA: rhomboid family intramembrane serine protease [Vicinamibacterales bacterium]|jgi:membrane associated rhomboid family serine protease|nr:rhomboid family intramembrane serine protease [Vicinamibacterales bacterium]